MDNINIVTNNEEISFLSYMKRLFEIRQDCNNEHYLAEIFIPFLRMCCTDHTKIVPVFDDRKTGKQNTHNTTQAQKRMKTICAGTEGDCTETERDSYVVPDYIYVSLDYSFDNPTKPYLMIETKNPIIIKNGRNINDDLVYYRDLKDFIKEYEPQLLAEIKACGYVIYTDGIKWMFLEENNGEIVESTKYKTISLVDTGKKYYSTNSITVKHDIKQVDSGVIGEGICEVMDDPKEWQELKKTIKDLLCECVDKMQKK